MTISGYAILSAPLKLQPMALYKYAYYYDYYNSENKPGCISGIIQLRARNCFLLTGDW